MLSGRKIELDDSKMMKCAAFKTNINLQKTGSIIDLDVPKLFMGNNKLQNMFEIIPLLVGQTVHIIPTYTQV